MNFSIRHSRLLPKSSDDNTNVVNAPQEPFVVNQDPGEKSSPSPLPIDHCCHECGEFIDGIFCRQCTCKTCGKVIQKKEEERRIAEEQAAEDRYWKIPICYDDDEDDTITITPVLPTRSPDDDSTYGEDIEYVDASPPDVEIVSLEVVDIIDPEVERINDDILLTIKDDILREKIPNLECFKFKIDPDPGDLDSIDLGIRKNVSTTNVNVPLEDDQSSLSAYVNFPDCEDSRAYGFHILSFILGIEYPNLIG
ncbi:hypothetical protein Tco_1219411 [Tanacetum coccineum]